MAFFHHSMFVIAFAVRMGKHKLFYLLNYLLILFILIFTNQSFLYVSQEHLTSGMWSVLSHTYIRLLRFAVTHDVTGY